METTPSNEDGRSELPSELGFALAPREIDPAPVCDMFERGKSSGSDLCHGH